MELGKAKKILEREKNVIKVEYLRKAKIVKVYTINNELSPSLLINLFPNSRISVEQNNFLGIVNYTHTIILRK